MQNLTKNAYFQLLRVDHWFKNLFLLFGILAGFWYLGQPITSNQLLGRTFLAFLLAALISSVNYIVNQITDAKFDARHDQKKQRPIPSGKVSLKDAIGLGVLLFILTLSVSVNLYPASFTLTLFALWVAGILYNLPPPRLKDIPFVDVLAESANNPLRFLLGWFLVVPAQFPPLSVLVLTLTVGAMFMSAKRYDELHVFGKQLFLYRFTFQTYSLKTLKQLIYFYAGISLLLFAYISFQYQINLLFGWLPLAFFLIWVMREIVSGKANARFIESFVLSGRFLFFSFVILALLLVLAFG